MIGAMASTALREGAKLWRTTLVRIGHHFWENPRTLVLFVVRLLGSMVRTEGARGTMEPGAFLLLPTVRMFIKSLLRGILPVLVIGVAGGLALGSIVGALGPLLRTALEAPALRIILADIVPLLLAILLVSRNGSAIAARLALLPVPHSLNRDRLLAEVLPSLLTAPAVALIFHLTLVACAVGGLLVGSTHDPNRVNTLPSLLPMTHDYIISTFAADDYVQARGLWDVVRDGALKSLLFGGIVAYVSAAFGVRAAEQQMPQAEEYRDFYDAVWESGVTSMTFCGLLTFLLWTGV